MFGSVKSDFYSAVKYLYHEHTLICCMVTVVQQQVTLAENAD